ncbi:hypothetical protein ABIF38_001632 [Bradyrhizobium japonicum]
MSDQHKVAQKAKAPLDPIQGRFALRVRSLRYSATVCTTLPIGRPVAIGFSVFTIIASYSGSVSSWVLAFIQTTL